MLAMLRTTKISAVEAGDGGGRHTRVGAANPEDLGRLTRSEAVEEHRVSADGISDSFLVAGEDHVKVLPLARAT